MVLSTMVSATFTKENSEMIRFVAEVFTERPKEVYMTESGPTMFKRARAKKYGLTAHFTKAIIAMA